MRNLPLPIKIILNTIIGVIYFLIVFYSSSFLLGFILGMIGITDLKFEDIISIVGTTSTISVIITLIFRRKFYIMKSIITETNIQAE